MSEVSEPSISSIFIGRWMNMELIEGSETSAIGTQTPGNYPKGKYIKYVTVVNMTVFCSFAEILDTLLFKLQKFPLFFFLYFS